MNLNQIKYFYKICQCGSLSEAAQNLYISQPSLSSAIKSLEKEFGVILFNRTHAGMQLTSEGKIFLHSCKDLISRTDQLEDMMKDLGNQRHKLKLGIPPMIGSLIVPEIFKTFCKENPDINLEIIEAGRDELLNKLSENLLDFVFLLQNNPIDSNFTSKIIGKLEIVCCASKENPISTNTLVTPHILHNIPLVLFDNSFYQTDKIKKWFASGNIQPNIIMQTKQLSTMLSMISHNVAVGFAFKEIARTYNNFKMLPCETPLWSDVCLVWNKNSYNSSSMDKFKMYINEFNLFLPKNINR